MIKADDNSTPWYVNHAIFVSDITTVFPVAVALCNTKTLGSGQGFPGSVVDGFGVSRDLSDVAMKPMQVQQAITSILDVTITDDAEDMVAGFQTAMITKNVPTAVWDKCEYRYLFACC